MFYTHRDERTPRERELESQLDDLRAQEERRQDDERRASQERQREMQERWNENMRSASDWKEALGKQAILLQREANYDTGLPDDFFGPGAKACTRALEIWNEVESTRAAEINQLQERLAAIQEEIRFAVSDKLAGESDARGWQNVAQTLRSDEDPENWLNW